MKYFLLIRNNQIILLGLIIIFLYLSNSGINIIFGENSIVEILQAIVLSTGVILLLKFRKLILKFSDKFSYYSRFSFFIFLLYEELSFITKFFDINFFNTFNKQAEINLHNLEIFYDFHVFENLKIPLLNYSFDLSLYLLLYSTILFFIGFGSFLKIFKKFKLLFIESSFSLYTFIYLINIIVHSIQEGFFQKNADLLIHAEFIELFIYILFLLDTNYKVLKFKKKHTQFF